MLALSSREMFQAKGRIAQDVHQMLQGFNGVFVLFRLLVAQSDDKPVSENLACALAGVAPGCSNARTVAVNKLFNERFIIRSAIDVFTNQVIIIFSTALKGLSANNACAASYRLVMLLFFKNAW